MNRRQLLERIVQGFTATALVAFAFPFLKSFFPSFSNDLTREVDISDLRPGESKSVHWLGRNLVIVRRKPEVIAKLRREGTQTALDKNTNQFISAEKLKDPDSAHSNQPAFAENVYRSQRPELFVAFTNCTHLGCEVEIQASHFTCPCHQSEYDAAGRVVVGAAAPTNLEIPNYKYLSRNVIQLEPEEKS